MKEKVDSNMSNAFGYDDGEEMMSRMRKMMMMKMTTIFILLVVAIVGRPWPSQHLLRKEGERHYVHNNNQSTLAFVSDATLTIDSIRRRCKCVSLMKDIRRFGRWHLMIYMTCM